MPVKRFRAWLRATLRRRAMERQMDEELRFHVERYAEDLMRGGMERAAAERQARLEFGSIGQTKESCREARSFERRYFPGRSALGRRVHTSGWRTIIGVVGDVRMRELDTAPPMQFYLPLWQAPSAAVALVVRAAIAPEAAASALRGVVRNMDPALAMAGARTMDELVSEASAERRFQTVVLTVFGGISLFLSLLGLYALMAYAVQQRTPEIGIRMALGAQSRSIMALILRQGMTLWLGGIGLGLVCAMGVTRWIRSLLFEVQPTDPLTFAGVLILFCAVAVVACYIPARRATRVDPLICLRYE